MTLRLLNVDLDALTVAMNDRLRDGREHVLDLETGEVRMLMLEFEPDEDDEANREEDGAADASLHPWQQEAREEIRLVRGHPDRFVDIPVTETYEAYEIMRRFVEEEVSNPRLRSRLEDAISGKGAFRRFKDVLLQYPADRERWFQFEQRESFRQAEEWLESIGIKTTWSPPWQSG